MTSGAAKGASLTNAADCNCLGGLTANPAHNMVQEIALVKMQEFAIAPTLVRHQPRLTTQFSAVGSRPRFAI